MQGLTTAPSPHRYAHADVFLSLPLWARKIAELGNHTMAPNHGLDGVSDYRTPLHADAHHGAIPAHHGATPAHHCVRSLPHRWAARTS